MIDIPTVFTSKVRSALTLHEVDEPRGPALVVIEARNRGSIAGRLVIADTPSSISPAQTKRVENLTESDFKELALRSPDQLVSYVASTRLRPAQLAVAATALGDVPTRPALEALVALLEHESPLVREGTIYGLARTRTAAVIEKLQRVAQQDVSPGVRAAASEALEE